jgi:gas vesicle protein
MEREKERLTMASNNKLTATFFFLVGITAGAALALLLAPNSGEETRELIRQRAEDGREYVNAKRDDLLRKADRMVERGKKEMKRRAEDLIDKGFETVDGWKEKGKAFASRVA